MGGLALPGSRTGPKGPPRSPRLRQAPPLGQWFPEFLRGELAPYPGRASLALRYVLAATLTMLIIVSFRVPGAATGGFYSLLLPRDTPLTTARAARSLLAAICLSSALSQMGALLFVNYPLTHFLWVAGSFFVAFYALAVVTNYASASAFAILTVLTVPAWDLPLPTAAIVVANLWIAGSISVAMFATLLVETAFALFRRSDPLQEGFTHRLAAVEQWMAQSARGELQPKTHAHLEQLATVGVSRLRRIAGAGDARQRAGRTTVVSLVGRLVDLTVTLNPVPPSATEAERRQSLARELRQISLQLQGAVRRTAAAASQVPDETFPLLGELERTAERLVVALSTGSNSVNPLDAVTPPDPPLFVPDAWSNPDHLHFALRGCAAAFSCYFLMQALHYPGLSTSLFTCVVTALSSVGTSRQKQLLRVSGAIVGGVIFGIGSQVLILPMLDSIGGFTVLFVSVIGFASWFITASPRISYFGTQMALAFFVVHLRTPFPQTNLAIARDNLIGILLGLVAMWFVFETLGSKPAVQVMLGLFAANLRLLAAMAVPWRESKPANLAEIRAQRDKLTQNFSALNAQADAVLFETGPTRARDLRVRDALLAWQPRLRSLFLLQISWLQYRTQINPEELAPDLLQAQIRFDRELHALLLQMAETFVRKRPAGSPAALQESYEELGRAIQQTYQGRPTARAQAILNLSSHLVEGAASLFRDLCAADIRLHGLAGSGHRV